MHTTLRSSLSCALLLVAPLAAVACSDATPNPNPPPQATAEPTATPSAEPTATPSAEPTAAPTAAPSGSAAAEVPTERPKAGRPPVLLADAKSITDTFGYSPGAKLELGDKDIATLRIPEGALSVATNVTFAIDTKCKSTGLVTGKIYKITPALPPSSTPVSVPTNNGAPFALTMPTGKKKDLNLAIGTFAKDAKGNDTLVWKIVAAKKTDEAAGTAEFHLDALPDACLHLSNKAVTQ